MSREFWFAVHLLAARIEAEYPTRGKLRALAKEIAGGSNESRKALLQEIEFLWLSLDELMTLLRDNSLL